MQKTCQNCKNIFELEPADLALLEKLKVPQPTFCPACRSQRRMATRNDNTIYMRPCDLCKKQTISMYAKNSPYTVYCKDCWTSDKWDPLSYGKEYDFSKPFFQQFHEWNLTVPQLAQYAIGTNENVDFTSFIIDCKDVYLSSSILYCENVMFSRNVDKSKDILACSNVKECESCFDLIDCSKCFNCRSSMFVYSSSECQFVFDAMSCQNCFMSSNLRKKQYIFRNKQLSKEDYEAELSKIDFGDPRVVKELETEYQLLVKNSFHIFANHRNVVHSTGNNLDGAKDSHNCFDCYELENVRYGIRFINAQDSMDILNGGGQLVYDSQTCGVGIYHQICCFGTAGSADVEYSSWCFNSNNLFACASLSKQEYCIFNKKYTPDEFAELRTKIIEHMNTMPYKDKKGSEYRYGEFFPIEISTFGYNEIYAQDHFPLTREEALTQGFRWNDEEPTAYTPTMQAKDLPKTSVADPVILKEVIACENDGKAYKIIKKEFDFVKARNLPLPTLCPVCRQAKRFQKRLPFKLWKRTCMCQGAKDSRNKTQHFHAEAVCPNEFMTPYNPDRPESIYCEQCYTSEVV